MKTCIICGRPHNATFVDRSYCSKACKVKDYDGDVAAVERDNVKVTKMTTIVVLVVLGLGAAGFVLPVIRIAWDKLFPQNAGAPFYSLAFERFTFLK